MRRAIPLLFTLLLAAAPARAARESRPTSADVVRLRAASALALSPDGARVAYVLESATFDTSARPKPDDPKAGWKRERQLWVADVATKRSRQLTRGDAMVSAPCWAPDGRTLVFTRETDGKSALRRLAIDGGESLPVETGELEPEAPAFSPDGKWIAFLAEAPLSESEKQARWARGGAMRWEHEFANAKLWVVPAAGGKPRLVPAGPHVISFAWSPNSARFAVVSSQSADPYLASSEAHGSIVEAAGSSREVRVRWPAGDFGEPRWSRDGRRFAFLALNGGLSNMNALVVCDPATGKTRNLAPDLDRTFGGFAWGADSKSLVAVVRARTATKLERFPLNGAPSALPFEGRVIDGDPVTDADAKLLAFLSSTDRSPNDVTVYDVEAGTPTVITHLNPQVGSWRLGDSRVVRWRNAGGQEIEGVLTMAHDNGSPLRTSPAPLIVLPHGGPDDVTSVRFSWLTQYFASRGYSVFRPNYRGSFGYGFEFYAANRDRFGEVEQADIESGVDQLVRDGLADANKLYYGGWSWGGYITTWTITHVHRYRAAVAGAAVSDVMHSYSLSDINHGVAAQWEYKGNPWNQPGNFDRVNPIRHVTNVKTPLLLLHGDADARVPFAESVQFYRALADLGQEVEFWAYPREDHGFVEPAHRVDYVKRWADWYDAH